MRWWNGPILKLLPSDTFFYLKLHHVQLADFPSFFSDHVSASGDHVPVLWNITGLIWMLCNSSLNNIYVLDELMQRCYFCSAECYSDKFSVIMFSVCTRMAVPSWCSAKWWQMRNGFTLLFKSNIQEDLKKLFGEKCASFISSMNLFSSALDSQVRQWTFSAQFNEHISNFSISDFSLISSDFRTYTIWAALLVCSNFWQHLCCLNNLIDRQHNTQIYISWN